MSPELVTIRCLRDNYAYLLHGAAGTVLFDAPEAAPILDVLKARGWTLTTIALTHHHDDHIQAVAELVAATGAEVVGNPADARRLPALDREAAVGATIDLAGFDAHVIDVSGHTVGHVAFHVPAANAAFTADSLMAMGCGRIFEGSAAQMWESLERLNALPDATLICSGHDYCAANGRFALSVEPGNAAVGERLASGRPCSPATLAEERRTNPFLRTAEIGPLIGMEGAAPAEVFARLRKMKDVF